MDDHAPSVVTASAWVAWPIGLLLIGLLAGFGLASARGLDELATLTLAARGGVAGFFLGLGVVVILALRARAGEGVSVRRLAAVVAVAAVGLWYATRVLLTLLGG